jgi:hypothetical protein
MRKRQTTAESDTDQNPKLLLELDIIVPKSDYEKLLVQASLPSLGRKVAKPGSVYQPPLGRSSFQDARLPVTETRYGLGRRLNQAARAADATYWRSRRNERHSGRTVSISESSPA